MVEKIRIGVLGCSSIAERSVIPAIIRNDRFELVAVGSRSKDKAESFGRRFGCQGKGYHELLADNLIDAIYVSLPVGMHFQWAELVLKAGKHLLLEKTFTTDLNEAKQLVDLAHEKKIIAMEALAYVYHPLFVRVSTLINDGVIGTLRHLEAQFGFPHRSDNDIRYQRALGGGAILDALVYPLSLSLRLGGKDIERYEHHVVYDKQRNVDVRGFVQIVWPDYSAQIAYGFGFMYRNTCTIWGETGYLTVSRIFTRPDNMVGEIQISDQDHSYTVQVEAANHFILMLNAFAEKIWRVDTSGMNEGHDILSRMEIISNLHLDFEKRYPHAHGSVNEIP